MNSTKVTSAANRNCDFSKRNHRHGSGRQTPMHAADGAAFRGRVVSIDCSNVGRAGHAYASHFKLRTRMFYAQYWEAVASFKGLEYDQYDTPAATYLVFTDLKGKARGCLRLSPTDRPYMIRDYWRKLCKVRPLPNSLSEWEMTRFCIDDDLAPEERLHVKRSLVCALFEFGILADIRKFIAITSPKLWHNLFTGVGCRIEFLGASAIIGGDEVRVALIPVDVAQLRVMRRCLGINGSLLPGGPVFPSRAMKLPSVQELFATTSPEDVAQG